MKIEYDTATPGQVTKTTLNKVENAIINDAATLKALMTQFTVAMANDFAFYGEEVIENIRKESPVAYARILTSLFPRQVETKSEVNISTQAQLTVEQINAKIGELIDVNKQTYSKELEIYTSDEGSSSGRE